MEPIVDFLNDQSMVALFSIIAIGSFIGSPSVRGLSLGSSGVLFVALLFGHFGVNIPPVVLTLGVILFVYAVGLQAGPRFVRSFQRRGLQYLSMSGVTLGCAFVACLVLALYLDLPPNFTAGMFAGALTSTPGLAAGLEILADPTVSIGYGAAYPFGVISVILFVQLVPKLFGLDLKTEEERARESSEADPVTNAWFQVQNPLIAGKSVDEVASAHLTNMLLSRVAKDGEMLAAKPDIQLELGDHVRAVGTAHDLRRLEMIIGPKVPDLLEARSHVGTVTLYVTERRVSGRTLAELQFRERFGVNITRIFRDEFEFVPKGSSRLELGDTIRVAGSKEDCERIIPIVGHQEDKLRETNFLPLALGLVAGVLLGLLPLPAPGGLQMRLGLAGGPLIAGLIAGHFGQVGQLSFRIPVAALFFIRELGLLFFLAGAGVSAGHEFVSVLKQQGWTTILLAVCTAWAPMAMAYFFARSVLRWDALTSLGAVCGAMTSTPGLGAVTKMSRAPAASLAYVAIYPAALIGTTVLTPAIGVALAAWYAGGP